LGQPFPGVLRALPSRLEILLDELFSKRIKKLGRHFGAGGIARNLDDAVSSGGLDLNAAGRDSDRLPPKLVGCGRRNSQSLSPRADAIRRSQNLGSLTALQFFNNSIEKRPALQNSYLRQDLVFRRTGSRHGRRADILHVQEVIVKALDLQS